MTERPPRLGFGLVASGVSVVLLGACMGWVRSGATMRNSFATVRSARSLGVLEGGWEAAASAWYLLPLAVGLCWLAIAARRPGLTGALAAVVGVTGALAVLAVSRAPLSRGQGPFVSASGSALALAGAVTLAFDVRRRSL